MQARKIRSTEFQGELGWRRRQERRRDLTRERTHSSYKGIIKGTKFLKQQGKAEEFLKGRLRQGSGECPQTAPQLVMEVNCFSNGYQIIYFFKIR